MWAIMKQFNMLPNDPRLIALNVEQRDFIILSMNEDIAEKDRAMRGVTIDSDYADKTFEDEVVNSGNDWEIMHNGQDPAQIYAQVVAKTGDASYEEKSKARIEDALTNKVAHKKQQLKDVSAYQAKIIKQAREKAKRLEQAKTVSSSDLSSDDEFLE